MNRSISPAVIDASDRPVEAFDGSCPALCQDGKVCSFDYYDRDVWDDCPECGGAGYVRCDEPGCTDAAEFTVGDMKACAGHALEMNKAA